MYALKVKDEVVMKSENLQKIWKKFDELFLKGKETKDMTILINYNETVTISADRNAKEGAI